MDPVEHLQRARDAFREDLAHPPALTLRGANAVDSYDRPEPFDAALDEPTDEYVERLTFWAMPYLDAHMCAVATALVPRIRPAWTGGECCDVLDMPSNA